MIQVSNLTRYYGAFPALQDVSFHADEGEVIGLLGLNGAGKSTALKILAGILSPTSGSVTMSGTDVTDHADSLKSQIGFLPEEPPLYRDMTVTAFLLYVARMKGMSHSAALARMGEVMRITGLQGREHQVIDTLSHGFKKRVGIAMAVVHDPKLLILDEPISGLDPKQIKEMRRVIRGLGKDRVVLISSHNLTEISRTCDRLVMLRDGKKVAEGTQDELIRHIGEHRVTLTLRADAAMLGPWLDSSDIVSSHSVVEAPEGRVVATIALSGDHREQLIADVSASGFGVWLVEEADVSLEDIFLRYTSQGDASA